MTVEYARPIKATDDRNEPEILGVALQHLTGVEVVITDNIYSSVLKRTPKTDPDYDYVSSLTGASDLLKATGLTHEGPNGTWAVYLNPEVSPGIVAHESLHLLEESKFPNHGQEGWTYPLGSLTDAALKVQAEALKAKTFRPTAASQQRSPHPEQDLAKATNIIMQQLIEAREEHGLPALTHDEQQEIRSSLDPFAPPSHIENLSSLLQFLAGSEPILAREPQ